MVVEGFVDVTVLLGGGVYMLLRRGKVVYVGQSQCLLKRIATHRANARQARPAWLAPSARGIVFDEVQVLPVHPDRMSELEQSLIKFYNPIYNTTHRQGPKPDLGELLGLYETPPPKPNPYAGRRL